MSVASREYPEILLTGPGPTVAIPAWVRKFKPKTATGARLRHLRKLPAVTVIQANEPDFIAQHRAFVHRLATTHGLTPGPSKVLVVFGSRGAEKSNLLTSWLKIFSRTSDVEFARNADEAAFALERAFAKIQAVADQALPARTESDPLAKVKAILAATADLRGPSGRLSADRVAEAFGISLAELAALAGKSRQTLSKTPDALSAQPALRAFERAARLRAVLEGGEFRQWLNASNRQFDDRSPIELIRSGRIDLVANLAEDILTGQPD